MPSILKMILSKRSVSHQLKYIFLLFSFCLLALNVSAEPGDVDGDGVINDDDLVMLTDHILGRATATGDPDCNEDGVVNVANGVTLNGLTPYTTYYYKVTFL